MLERIFLTKNNAWKGYIQPGEKIKLGFLSTDENKIISVEIIEVNGKKVKAQLCIYQAARIPDAKNFNFLVSIEEAEELLKLCVKPTIDFTKYLFGVKRGFSSSDPQVWYVKEYSGPHTGIVITGVELKDVNETLFPPEWVGKEVTDNKDYQDCSFFNLLKN